MGRKPCCDSVGLKKGSWTAEEDKKLINFILLNGHCCWRAVPKLAGLLRCGKSCRLRWINYLRPDLKRGLLSDAEEQIVINLHSKLGNRWSKIAGHLPGRTDNEIKNHWNTHIKKKLKKIGIDPQTHKPICPNVDQKQVQDSKEEEEGYNPSSSSVTDQSPSSYEEEQEITKSNPISSMDLEEYSYSELLLDEIPGFTIDEVPMIQPHEITTITSTTTTTSSSSSSSSSSLSNLDSRNYSNQLNSPIMEWDENSYFWGFDDFNELDQLLRLDPFLQY